MGVVNIPVNVPTKLAQDSLHCSWWVSPGEPAISCGWLEKKEEASHWPSVSRFSLEISSKRQTSSGGLNQKSRISPKQKHKKLLSRESYRILCYCYIETWGKSCFLIIHTKLGCTYFAVLGSLRSSVRL